MLCTSGGKVCPLFREFFIFTFFSH
jgi:hypothetical protein